MRETTLRYKAFDSRVALGLYGEKIVAKLLRLQGFKVKILRYGKTDIIATCKKTGLVLRIEVKTAKIHSDKKWRFTTIPSHGRSHSANSDVVICLQVTQDYKYVPYIIPVKDITSKPSICITSAPDKYSGKYSIYRRNWSMLRNV